jgi:Ca2+-binding EF-hand superfamily protein
VFFSYSVTAFCISSSSLSRSVGGDKSKKYDYAAAFNLFDEDGKGTISPDEFHHMLLRLQIISQTAER